MSDAENDVAVDLNRVRALDTPSLSDAMDSIGFSGHINEVVRRTGVGTVAGWARTISYRPLTYAESLEYQSAADYIDGIESDEFVVVDNNGRGDCTSWGDILTSRAINRRIAGSLIYGAVRDIHAIKETGYTVASKAVGMVSGKNRVVADRFDERVVLGRILVCAGDLIVVDDNGALCIPRSLASRVVALAENVDATEFRISSAIRGKMDLRDARQKFHYDTPWRGEG